MLDVSGDQEEGLSSVGLDDVIDGILGTSNEEGADVSAVLGLKNDVPKDVS